MDRGFAQRLEMHHFWITVGNQAIAILVVVAKMRCSGSGGLLAAFPLTIDSCSRRCKERDARVAFGGGGARG